MPNHITNIIKIKDAGNTDIATIRAAFLNENGQIDFNVIKPMPGCLKDFEPHTGIILAAKALLQTDLSDNPLLNRMEAHNRLDSLQKFKDFSADDRQAVYRAIENHYECGSCYWYDWSNQNWGSKWNAYDQPENGFELDATEFRFQTAWAHPKELISIVSTKLPDVTFLIQYADEDLGSNCGTYQIKNGQVTDADIAPGYDEQTPDLRRKYLEFAFNLTNPGKDPRSYGFDENWQYSDEIYEQYEAETQANEPHL